MVCVHKQARQRNSKVKLNQCAQQASLKFYLFLTACSLNFLKGERSGVQNAQKHDCTEEYTYVEKYVRKLLLQKNILVSANGKLTQLYQLASLFRRQKNFYHSETTRKPLTLNNVATV
jgi:hypothetical protein